MSIQTVRAFVLQRKARGQALHQAADAIARATGTSEADATMALEALADEGFLTRRFWIHCPSCSEALQNETDRSKLSAPWCPTCHKGLDDYKVITSYALAPDGRHQPGSVPDMLPGPELDFLVAQTMGMLPCDGWSAGSMGSTFGPVLFNIGCYHATGACWPTTTGWVEGLGGIPGFSTRRNHAQSLTLADLPPDTTLRRDAAGTWWVRVPGMTEIAGQTECHALALAFVASASREPPRWNENNRWREGWQNAAVKYGICLTPPTLPGDLPAPWTPALLHLLSQYDDSVEAQVTNLTRTYLEATRPNPKDRVIISTDPSQKEQIERANTTFNAAGVPAAILDRVRDAAAERGKAAAHEAFHTYTTILADRKPQPRAKKKR